MKVIAPKWISKTSGVYGLFSSLSSLQSCGETGGKEIQVGVVMNKPFYVFASLAVLFLGLSLYAPPSWYEWIPVRQHPVVVFPALCAAFTLWTMFHIPFIGNYLVRKGILVDSSKED